MPSNQFSFRVSDEMRAQMKANDHYNWSAICKTAIRDTLKGQSEINDYKYQELRRKIEEVLEST